MVFFLAHQAKKDLAVLRELLETGKITPVIDRAYRPRLSRVLTPKTRRFSPTRSGWRFSSCSTR